MMLRILSKEKTPLDGLRNILPYGGTNGSLAMLVTLKILLRFMKI